MSLENKRPLPNFNHGSGDYSTKKQKNKRFPAFSSVPKAPPRSCPVSRVTTLRSLVKPPKPISFRDDSDSIAFISDSLIYSNKKKETYFHQCFTVVEQLGAGSFGEVCKVRSKEDGKIYACKKTILKYKSQNDRNERLEEVKKLEKLPPHKNCVKFYRAWEEDKHLYFLTEACKTSLSEITNQKHDLTNWEVWSYVVDVLQGLKHLHENNMIHMDLKPDNIFIGEDNLCKIGDFGLVLDISKGLPIDGMDGDSRYVALECVQNRLFSPAADMFSLGLTLLELATDIYLPSDGPQWHELREGILPPVVEGLPSDLRHLLIQLTNADPRYRITASRALELFSVKKIILAKKALSTVGCMLFVAEKLFNPIILVSFYIFSVIASLWGKRLTNVGGSEGTYKIIDEDSFSKDVSNFSNSLLNYSDEEMDGDSSCDGLNQSCMAMPLNSTPLSSSKFLRDNYHIYNRGISLSRQSVMNAMRNTVRTTPDVSDSSPLSPDYNVRRYPPMVNSPPPFSKTSRNLLEVFSSLESDEED